uniref:Uncharacterized protein n=1 Tax=Solanum tuberosum TaxID=4113 RepID=M1D9M2_SOLTU
MKKHYIIDRESAIMTVPISSIAPEAGVSLNIDKQQRLDGDEAATLMEVPISFVALEKAKVDVLQVHDLMFMDDFMMFRCTLECWNELENIGTLLRNKYEKVGKKWEELASLGSERRGAPALKLQRTCWGALAGASPQGVNFKAPFGVHWLARCPTHFPRYLRTFLLRFSTLNPLNFNDSFSKHLGSFIPSIYDRFKPKFHPET